jgi:hypothetical protein
MRISFGDRATDIAAIKYKDAGAPASASWLCARHGQSLGGESPLGEEVVLIPS